MIASLGTLLLNPSWLVDVTFTITLPTIEEVLVVVVNGGGEGNQIPLTSIPEALVCLCHELGGLFAGNRVYSMFSIGLLSIRSNY